MTGGEGKPERRRAVVVGGGFFGATVAAHLAARFEEVVLVEREAELMARASYGNQARVHQGYHYPRSLTTALRSRVNFSRFVTRYAECIASEFEKYYAIARLRSTVSAGQFVRFCERIGAPIEPASPRITRLFDAEMVEGVFRVQEFAFDARKLRVLVAGELAEAGVDVRLSTRAVRLGRGEAMPLWIACERDGDEEILEADAVFDCTYAALNALARATGEAETPLKHELAEIALVDVPEELAEMGVTVMCGPFFSVMPFPAEGCHSLSHVRYTPYRSWERSGEETRAVERGRCSQYVQMVQDAARYLPAMSRCRYRESLWEVKTVLPASEYNDSRPILFREMESLPGAYQVLGAKIDNVFDALDVLDTVCPQLEAERCHGSTASYPS